MIGLQFGLLLLMLALSSRAQLADDYCDLSKDEWLRHPQEQDMFFVSADERCYTYDMGVEVMLFSDISQPFHGFSIQASKSDGNGTYGTFKVEDPVTLISCDFEYENVAMLSGNLGMNYTYIKLTWYPNMDFDYFGNITFNATFIDGQGVKIYNVTSNPISFNASCGENKTEMVEDDWCALVPTNQRMYISHDDDLDYYIELSQDCYSRNEMIDVTLYSKIDAPFIGFVMQAQRFDSERRMIDSSSINGMWEMPMDDPSGDNIQILNCMGNANTIGVHTPDEEHVAIVLRWYPADPMSEMDWTLDMDSVVFNATMIIEGDYHIMNVTSSVLKYDMYCGKTPIPPIGSASGMVSSVFMLFFNAILITYFL